jgi:osmotically-inducible protein OsmY
MFVVRYLLTLVLVACGASNQTTVTSATVWRGGQGDDELLAIALDHTLSKDARLSIAAKNVRITTNGGVAILAGSVRSADDASVVRAAVDATPGVTSSVDHLVISTTRDAGDEESDPAIARRVTGAVHDPAVHPSCHRGIVKLEGQVRSDADRQAAEAQAQWIPGVIAVWNDLDVR